MSTTVQSNGHREVKVDEVRALLSDEDYVAVELVRASSCAVAGAFWLGALWALYRRVGRA